ncbi:MAG TPA: Holliday junction resolvase RuvX [Longimicrobiales bacterium]|nr:Holliday junction resolvase RuvX [Longimicrobiales bacterium]
MSRIIGIDFGERRIGIAISDPTATIAQPLTVLRRRAGKRPPVQAIADLISLHGAEHIVVGLPLTLAGDESDWTREVRAFGDKLAERAGTGVSFADERMTSVAAERAVRSMGLKRTEREQKERIDAAAAVIILQAHLDSMKRQQ